MLCDRIQEKMKEFLEDLLPEKERRDVRSHLVGCSACRGYAESLGTFASDFKQLARVSLPAGFGGRLHDAFSRVEKPTSAEGAWSLKAGFAAFLVLSLIIFAGVRVNDWIRWRKDEAKRLKDAKNAQVVLDELKEIDAALARRTGGSLDEKLDIRNGHPKGPIVADLKPLHWRLGLRNAAVRSGLLDTLRAAQAVIHFESAEAVIFSLPPAEVSKFVSYLLRLPETDIQGSLQDMKNFPQPANPVRVSLVFFEPGKLTFHYWVFRFLLANRFVFMDQIEREGVQVLHQSPEIAVLEIQPGALEGFKESIRAVNGLTVDWGPEPAAKPGPQRVLLYIAEG